MIQQFNSKFDNENFSRSFKMIRILPHLNLQKSAQLLRYFGIAVLALIYLIIAVFCLITDHPMSVYLLLPFTVIFLIIGIAIIPMLKKN